MDNPNNKVPAIISGQSERGFLSLWVFNDDQVIETNKLLDYVPILEKENRFVTEERDSLISMLEMQRYKMNLDQNIGNGYETLYEKQKEISDLYIDKWENERLETNRLNRELVGAEKALKRARFWNKLKTIGMPVVFGAGILTGILLQ